MPGSGAHPSSELVLVGVNHRSSSGAVRDLICTEETEVPGVLARLQAGGLSEFLWLSTCDRVEVLAASDDPGADGRHRGRRLGRAGRHDGAGAGARSFTP